MFNPLLNIFNIQSKLKAMWVDCSNVNRNDSNAVNDFAKQIMTWYINNNPSMAKQIKDIANNVCGDKAKEVVETIDNIDK